MSENPLAAAAAFQAKIRALTQGQKPDPQAIGQAVQEMVTSFVSSIQEAKAEASSKPRKKQRQA